MFAVLLDLLLRPFTKTHAILKDMGSGSFGTVLLTRHRADSLLYVAKFIKKSKIKEFVADKSGGSVEEVPLEIYLLSRLSHPHIVTCVGRFHLPQHWVFTMPYLENYVDLKTFISYHTTLSEPVARSVLIQTYDVLVYCLSVGVDHRDIKHQNILIHTTSLQIQLIDFGLASMCDSKTVYTSVRGTELFLPPEALVQHHYTPLEATTWSLGCLLYCMLTGRPPFTSRREVVFSDPPLPPFLSSFCVDFLTQTLNKVRHQRLRFENIRWHTWMNLDRYRNFLESSCVRNSNCSNTDFSCYSSVNSGQQSYNQNLLTPGTSSSR